MDETEGLKEFPVLRIAHVLRALAVSNHPGEALGAALLLRRVLMEFGIEEFASWVKKWAQFERSVHSAGEDWADVMFDEVLKCEAEAEIRAAGSVLWGDEIKRAENYEPLEEKATAHGADGAL